MIIKEKRFKELMNRAALEFTHIFTNLSHREDYTDEQRMQEAKRSAELWYANYIKANDITGYPEFNCPKIDNLIKDMTRGNDGTLDAVREKWMAIKREKALEKESDLTRIANKIRKMGYRVDVTEDDRIKLFREATVEDLLTQIRKKGFEVEGLKEIDREKD